MSKRPTPLKLAGVELLHDRDLRYEGDRRDQQYKRAWTATGGHFPRRALPDPLTPEQEFYFNALAQVRRYGGEPRCEPGRAVGFIRELDRMYREHGTLVLLTLRLLHLDGESLYWSGGREALVSGSKWAMTGLLSVKGKRIRSMLTVIERGLQDNTHQHSATHLSGLCASYQKALLEAPRGLGAGAGVELAPGLHGVIVGDTPQDRKALAQYIRKFPDARARLPTDDELHLEMLNEIAEHMICGGDDERVPLVWRFPRDWRPGRRLT
ncbi:hypothetical protein DAETH_10060 [Deinococcus aetherius]|uniref:Uncharacterized protein n=1 Tax=Deinococcus aetherius TaxID=200252 RepID=A0ABN6RCG9_9DEIO|nr:hypothetical protein [Deinococcus aetherius]BDP41037.1 hypothetical protein DAETH_10060 [Deinococcus aetherius]